MNPADIHPLVTIDSEVCWGTPVFRGTRVAIQTLFDYLNGGHGLDEFLSGFPSVSKEQAIEVINIAGRHFVETIAALGPFPWSESDLLRHTQQG